MKTLKAVYLVTVITGLLTGLSLSSSAPPKISQEPGTEN